MKQIYSSPASRKSTETPVGDLARRNDWLPRVRFDKRVNMRTILVVIAVLSLMPGYAFGPNYPHKPLRRFDQLDHSVFFFDKSQ